MQGVNRQAGAPARKIAPRLSVPGARGRPPKAQQQQRPAVLQQQQQQRPPVEQPQPQLKRPPAPVVPAQARVVSVKQLTSSSGAVAVGATGAAADEVKKVETMYPDSYHNVQIKSNLLKNKYDALIKEKEEMEAQFLKERRKMSQEKLQMEENHKVLEELVNDANKETAEVKKKLDDAEKKVKVQEQRCATNEEVIKALNQKLVQLTELKSLFQKNDVELQVTRSQLEKSVADNEEMRTEIANLEKDLEERNEEINLLSTKNMEMETAAKVKSDELDELRERCEDTEKRLETASDQVCMFFMLISFRF